MAAIAEGNPTSKTDPEGTLNAQSTGPLSDLPDHALVERARRNESAAFEALMRRYNRRLFRAARSVLGNESAAEDAVQEAYIRAFTNLDRYQPTGAFGAWLTRIAVNEALMLRRRIRRDTISLDELDESALSRAHISTADLEAQTDAMESISARELLEQAVESLPVPFRTVFVLRVVEQMSIDETASCLGINESTVKTRLHRAHRLLRARLARRLRRERVNIFEFAGSRCDRIVAHVLLKLNSAPL